MTRLAWTVALMLVAGCKGKLALVDKASILTGPAAFVWKSDTRFEARELPSMYGSVIFSKAALQVSVSDFPPGTLIEVGPQSARVSDGGWAMITLDMKPRLPGLRLDALEAPFEDKLALTIQPPGAESFALPLPPLKLSSYTLEDLLAAVENGPVLFGDEPAPPRDGPPRSLYWVRAPTGRARFGSARTIGELNAVAIAHRRPEVLARKTCGGYKRDGKPLPDVEMLVKETEVTVYDRRTGATIARRMFRGKDECPMFLIRFGNEPTIDAYDDNDGIASFLRALVQGTIREASVSEKSR
jgi:hypothetical protein